MRTFVVSGDFEKLLEGMTAVRHLAMSLNMLVLRFCDIVCVCFVKFEGSAIVGICTSFLRFMGFIRILE